MGFRTHEADLLTLNGTLPNDIFELIGNGLPVENGGTGATTASRAFYNIVSALSTVSSLSNSYYFPMQYSSSGRRISYSNLVSALTPSIASSISPSDIGACQIEYGTYKGAGSTSPKSITCSFSPILAGIEIWAKDDRAGVAEPNPRGYNASANYCLIDSVAKWPASYTKGYGFGAKTDPYSSSTSPISYGKKVGNTIYWYTALDEPSYQMNDSAITYCWFAIG